jgi:hypothetical protein
MNKLLEDFNKRRAMGPIDWKELNSCNDVPDKFFLDAF